MKHGQTHGGKGSAQRPSNYVKYADNYDAIFNKKSKDKPKKKEEEKK